MEYETKDSGQREDFATGARRDIQTGKGRYDLISPIFTKNLALELEKANAHGGEAALDIVAGLGMVPIRPLLRLAALYGRGARKYGADNWRKGMPFARTYNSLARHLNQWHEGLLDEDHLSAVVWGCLTLLETENLIKDGALGTELVNLGPYANRPRPATLQQL